LTVLAFDLDDTLYPELDFVMSGFDAVSDWLFGQFRLDKSRSMTQMVNYLNSHGRGEVFNLVLATHGLDSSATIRKCLSIYRSHEPKLTLSEEVRGVLEWARSNFPTYLVTDGNKLVQAKKIRALGLDEYFDGIFITHRFGLKAAKPSIYCFSKILERTGIDWGDLVYVADNPVKDFVGVNSMGGKTIGVCSSPYFNMESDPAYLPTKIIFRLSELPSVI
jgi:putative hydrolase of the HAD superfamily